ncbi:PucR family transcriptional regulator ligand-binding domain-containing protein (plasmid) [Rhodococcus opacus]|uniref:PucR family transcriptional regulator ligand-binding domain-containing protein n=1 Tax=Rhodococcus opacus TaxID=37919 RepID=UPI0034D22C5C
MGIDYTLGDLIADSHLNLKLLTGSAETLASPLYGAHSIEIENPSRWLDPGWLMLTMGIRLRQRPSEQRQLIKDLQALGATALGFGVGVAFKTVPPALLEEAAARNFPVIMVPVDTQFHEISRLVFQATVSSEAQTYTRLMSLQQNMMRGFADPDPIESTLRRLARFANVVAAVVGTDGTVHASTGTLPYQEIAGKLVDRPLRAAPWPSTTGRSFLPRLALGRRVNQFL